jgi:hypothetical protein
MTEGAPAKAGGSTRVGGSKQPQTAITAACGCTLILDRVDVRRA